jgi:hypothetical protein
MLQIIGEILQIQQLKHLKSMVIFPFKFIFPSSSLSDGKKTIKSLGGSCVQEGIWGGEGDFDGVDQCDHWVGASCGAHRLSATGVVARKQW